MVIANVLAPVLERSLQATTLRFQRLGNARSAIHDLLRSGELEKETVGGSSYIWPHSTRVRKDAPRIVRFLAPFDPLVWDRRRFEHLWGWPYRFEAYTPQAKRLRGYYAMPLLWGESIVGWANARMENQRLSIDVGFAGTRPTEAEFQTELEAEIERLKTFLNWETSSGRAIACRAEGNILEN
jgi:hypothetical protein